MFFHVFLAFVSDKIIKIKDYKSWKYELYNLNQADKTTNKN